MSNIAVIVTQMAAIEGGITGVHQAFDNTPDNIDDFPAFINIIDEAEIWRPDAGQGTRITTHVVNAILLVAKQAEQTDAERIARPFLQRTIDKFDVNKTLGNTTITNNITKAKYGKVNLGSGVDYLGWQFRVEAVEEETGVLFASSS